MRAVKSRPFFYSFGRGCWGVSVVFISSFLTSTALAAPYKLIGSDLFPSGFDTKLYDIDLATGAASNPCSTGQDGLIGIALEPGTGQLYSMSVLSVLPHNSLFKVDSVSGVAVAQGWTGLTNTSEGDLAFNPVNGALYGVGSLDYFSGLLFYSIDTLTAQATVLGVITRYGDYSTLAFDSDGTLYSIDCSADELCVLNPANGAFLSSIPLSVKLGAVAGMAFHPSTGIAYVADGKTDGTDSLYTLDTSTGSLTLIGALGLPAGLGGLAFVPAPEPSSLALAAFAFLALAVCGTSQLLRRWDSVDKRSAPPACKRM